MSWNKLGLIADLKTPWIELIGETWRDDTGAELEYWRVVASHSVIVIARQGDRYLLPEPMFRPGVDRSTLDFCGGRLKPGVAPRDAAQEILGRELGLRPDDLVTLDMVNAMPLLVNSSASNQQLHGFYAEVSPEVDLTSLKPHRRFPVECGAKELLAQLDCLQCRALLLETMLAGAG